VKQATATMPATTVVSPRPLVEAVPAGGDVPPPGSTPAADATAVDAGACDDDGLVTPEAGGTVPTGLGGGDVAGGRCVGLGVGVGVGLGVGGAGAFRTVGGFVRK
jgi:hypothetical protein